MAFSIEERKAHAKYLRQKAVERAEKLRNKYPDIDLIMLSGSVLTENVTKYSDIDIGVLVEKKLYDHTSAIIDGEAMIGGPSGTWDEIKPLLSNPAHEYYAMLMHTFQSSEILYAKNEDVKQQFHEMTHPLIDEKVRGKMKSYSIERGKKVEEWLGNLYLAASSLDLVDLKLRVSNFVGIKSSQLALYYNQFVYRNHGTSDRDIRNLQGKPEEYESLVKHIFRAQSKEELLQLSTTLAYRIRQFFKELESHDGSQNQSKSHEWQSDQKKWIWIIDRLDRVLSELYKPDQIGFYVNYLKCYKDILKFHAKYPLPSEFIDEIHPQRVEFNEHSRDKLLKIRTHIMEYIDEDLKFESFEEYLDHQE